MKNKGIPSHINDDYITVVIDECVNFIRGQAPWWVARSCLNCPEARLLMQVLLASYSVWRQRQAQQVQHKRKLPKHNRFDLRPLIYDLCYTVERLANADQAHLNPQLKKSLKLSCTLSLNHLKEWHNIEIGDFNELQLALVS